MAVSYDSARGAWVSSLKPGSIFSSREQAEAFDTSVTREQRMRTSPTYDPNDPAQAAAAKDWRRGAEGETAAGRNLSEDVAVAHRIAAENPTPLTPEPGQGPTAYSQRQADYLRSRAGDIEGMRPDTSRTEGASQDLLQSRFGQEQALANLMRRASGEESIAQQQGLLESEALRRSVMSQMAGAGRFDPGIARAGLSALADSQSQLGARTTMAAAQERQAAQDAYLAGAGQLRGQDLQRFGAVAGQEESLRNFLLGKGQLGLGYEQLGLGYQQLGTADRQYGEQMQESRRREQRARIDAYLQIAQMERAKSDQERAALAQGLGGIFGTLAGGALGFMAGGPAGALAGGAVGGGVTRAATSDRAAKAGIAKGDTATRELLKVLAGSQLPLVAQTAQAGAYQPSPLLEPDPAAVQAARDQSLWERSRLPAPGLDPTGMLASQAEDAERERARERLRQMLAQQAAADRQQQQAAPEVSGRDRLMLMGTLANAFGGLGGEIGRLSALSDVGAKRDIAPQSAAVRQFLGALQPYTYRYTGDARDAGAPAGRQLGVMAQNLERGGPMAASLVGQDAATGYRTIDQGPRMGSAVLAGLGNIDQRLRALERGR